MRPQSLDRLSRHVSPAGGRLLLLGDAVRLADRARALGWRPHAAGEGTTFGVEPGSCRAALLEDAVARDPWDRWLLQRVHRALEPGGVLLAEEPNQFDLASPGGLGYVASRAARQGALRLRRALPGAPPPGPSFVGRRPSLARLLTMLGGLRFEVLESWSDRGAGWGAVLPARFAARIGVVARANPSVAGLHDPWPEERQHRRAYELAQSAMLATRRAWAEANPRRVSERPERFAPARYAGRTVVVLAPHPDDEVIGACGTLLALVRAGARVVCVQATDGSAGAALERTPEPLRREIRLREAEAVGRACGFASLELWRADNRAFRASRELEDRLVALLERERPALVLAPFVTEAHEDHVTLDVILARALARAALPADAQVFGYEVWSLVPANVVHDVTTLVPELEDTLFLYDTAMRIDDFVHFCADRALYHAWTYEGRPAYLEAFHAVPAPEYGDLLRTVRPELR